MKKIIFFALLLCFTFCFRPGAFAIPALQLYIEGSSYDIASQSWVNGNPEFTLWVLGNSGGPSGSIYDVKLVTAYPTGESGSITFVPTTATAGLLPSPYDTSVPSSPVFDQHGDGTRPQLNDGSYLPYHDVYGDETSWDTYSIGDFSSTDSPIGDYMYAPPTDFPSSGQINAYRVSVSGYTWVHFDAFDHYVADSRGRFNSFFAPFSHDATSTPEPATLVLLGFGIAGIFAFKRSKHVDALSKPRDATI